MIYYPKLYPVELYLAIEGSLWYDVLPDHMHDQWVRFFHCLFEFNQIVIPMCVKPNNSIDKPSLIIFSDEEAFGFSAYVKWKATDEYRSSMLIFSNSRVGLILLI